MGHNTSYNIISVHLGGPKTKKTSVVRASIALERAQSGIPPSPEHQAFESALKRWRENLPCNPLTTGIASKRSTPLLWNAFAHDLGPSPQQDADSRLLEAVLNLGPPDIICIDAPLSLPPCLSCCDEKCSPTQPCSHSGFQTTQEEWQRLRETGVKKVRSPLPYLDRYFEFFCRHHLDHPALASSHDFEPILGAGRAPLTMRAHHLQKRLRSLFPQALILETLTPLASIGFALACGYQPRKISQFRQDLENSTTRMAIMRRLESKLFAIRDAGMHQMVYRELWEHHETFLAAMGALSAWALLNGEAYVSKEFLHQVPEFPFQGWAIIPKEIADRAWHQ